MTKYFTTERNIFCCFFFFPRVEEYCIPKKQLFKEFKSHCAQGGKQRVKGSRSWGKELLPNFFAWGLPILAYPEEVTASVLTISTLSSLKRRRAGKGNGKEKMFSQLQKICFSLLAYNLYLQLISSFLIP